jgi:hypothetical protein
MTRHAEVTPGAPGPKAPSFRSITIPERMFGRVMILTDDRQRRNIDEDPRIFVEHRIGLWSGRHVSHPLAAVRLYMVAQVPHVRRICSAKRCVICRTRATIARSVVWVERRRVTSTAITQRTPGRGIQSSSWVITISFSALERRETA